jgi:hypothetical protein
MRTLKRIALFLIELLVEALLLGSLMGLLVSSHTGLQNGIIGSILSVPVMLVLHGYYLPRVLSVFVRSSAIKWHYPALACFVFIADAWFVFWQMGSSLSPFAEAVKIPFLAGGACIVTVCASIGIAISRRGAPSPRDSRLSEGTI